MATELVGPIGSERRLSERRVPNGNGGQWEDLSERLRDVHTCMERQRLKEKCCQNISDIEI